MKLLLPVFFAFLIAGCDSEQFDENGVNPEMIKDAVAFPIEGWEDGILPEAYWPQPIKELSPIRVYSDRANCVIALSEQDGFESGYYVYVSISSYLPGDNAEWSFSAIGENIWTYKRKLGVQDEAGQSTTRAAVVTDF